MSIRDIVATFLIAIWSLFTISADAKPVDLSAPSGEMGSSNALGFLEVWRDVEGVGIELGKGSYLPLRYGFSTESDKSGAFGAGFYVPMFEAKNILIRENTMLANLPCGKKLYLWRDPVDPKKFRSPDQQWNGNLNGDDFTLWRSDGWKLFYRQGRLVSIVSDDNRTFNWSYDVAGGGSVDQDGKSIITMEPAPAGQVAAFVFGEKRYKVEYSKRPIMEVVQGQAVLKELVPAVTRVIFPDGRVQTFEFGLRNEDHEPTLTTKDLSGASTEYTWDPASKHIASEKSSSNKWTYKIGEIASKFALPALSRTDNQGKIEGSVIDDEKGTYTAQARDGTKTITYVFENPGPLYHKVKSVERVTNGMVTILYKASYDAKGKLIRKIDSKGFATTYVYDESGKYHRQVLAAPSDSAILSALKEKEADLLKRVADTSDTETRGGLLEKLAFLYIHDFGMPNKALALLPQMDKRIQIFNVQFHAIDGDLNLTGQQKADKFQVLLKEYPEQEHLLKILIAARPLEDARTAQILSSE